MSDAEKAAQTWTTSARLVGLAAMTGNTEQHRIGLKFYCRSHWLVDLILSGLSTRTHDVHVINHVGTECELR